MVFYTRKIIRTTNVLTRASWPSFVCNAYKVGPSSGPTGHASMSVGIQTRSHRLTVRTLGFHPKNRGSIPLGTTKKYQLRLVFFIEVVPRGIERAQRNCLGQFRLPRTVSAQARTAIPSQGESNGFVRDRACVGHIAQTLDYASDMVREYSDSLLENKQCLSKPFITLVVPQNQT